MEHMDQLRNSHRSTPQVGLQVILVVHSMGGLIGSIAMEQFPEKIAVAVFVAALMFTDSTHERAGELAQVINCAHQADGLLNAPHLKQHVCTCMCRAP